MKLSTRNRKKFRIRNKVKKVSSADRYRLSISRSSKNISAQIIDDTKKITLVSSSSIEKDIRNLKKNKSELSSISNNSCSTKTSHLDFNNFCLISLSVYGWWNNCIGGHPLGVINPFMTIGSPINSSFSSTNPAPPGISLFLR